MTTCPKGILAAILLFGLSTCLSAEEKTDPSGTWRWEYDWNGENRQDAFRIELEKDGKVAGTYHGKNRTANIKEGKLDKDQLSVTIELDFEGTSFELVFAGKVDGDKIEGNVSGNGNGNDFDFPWNPTRSVKAEDVVGKWQIAIETGNGTLEPSMELSNENDKLKAVYTSQSGNELEVSNLKIEQNSLMFTVSGEFNGSKLTANYKGRPYGNKITGQIDYDFDGNAGQVDFTGKRKVEKKEEQVKKAEEQQKVKVE